MASFTGKKKQNKTINVSSLDGIMAETRGGKHLTRCHYSIYVATNRTVIVSSVFKNMPQY